MVAEDRNDLGKFLKDYPGMAIKPSRDEGLVLKGTFKFCATPPNRPEICDSYELEIFVPTSFPRAIPTVKELSRKIPRDGKHHVNADDTLCLGSPLRLLKKIAEHPNLQGFAEKCLVPFLYAASNKLHNGGEFVFSELAHGEAGIVADYMELLGLRTKAEVISALKLLGMKRRIANKLPCPCACERRLGSCPFHNNLNQLRNSAPRSWFNSHHRNLGAGV